MHRLLGFAFCVVLAVSPRIASANSCNLYGPQTWGQIRVGCSLTVFALPEVDPSLPNITRAGQPVSPTIDHDQLTLKVTLQHYLSPTSCDLATSYENRTFDRYVITWSDLQPGDEIEVDGYRMTVPGPGDCGVVDPFFYCQDGVQSCDAPADPGMNDVDQAGCSAGSGSPSWLALFPVVALLSYSRRHRPARPSR
ncbi:MAG TPA: MYXO-CTERM sorting domain-containing protein [Kofleriaceae bacterium]|nr:MYXO-CTERM sorting domain-containing protein [Kofleriaceae bacterium]